MTDILCVYVVPSSVSGACVIWRSAKVGQVTDRS